MIRLPVFCGYIVKIILRFWRLVLWAVRVLRWFKRSYTVIIRGPSCRFPVLMLFRHAFILLHLLFEFAQQLVEPGLLTEVMCWCWHCLSAAR